MERNTSKTLPTLPVQSRSCTGLRPVHVTSVSSPEKLESESQAWLTSWDGLRTAALALPAGTATGHKFSPPLVLPGHPAGTWPRALQQSPESLCSVWRQPRALSASLFHFTVKF